MTLLSILLLAGLHLVSCAVIPQPRATTTTKYVFAHHIVGNTYPYTQSNWASDISLAYSKGIDGFALNVGSDSWGQARVTDAYNAAKAQGTFKLFLSLDMSSLPCTTSANIATVANYVKAFANSSAQFTYNGRPFVSTFAGESCTFGQSNVNAGWNAVIKAIGSPIWFVPSFFVDPATFSTYNSTNGQFNWNGGWPMTDANVTFASDSNYISHLNGGTYMAAISPWFFTHYSPQTYNKNWIYYSDSWLLNTKWEQVIANRNSVPIVELVTWNDYGESSYMGPIEGAQPNSQAWVNWFNHQAWLDMQAYYITAYKTGSYPAVTKDQIFLWGRLYPKAASSSDSVAKPNNWNWAEDYLEAVTLLTSAANVTLTCGTSNRTFTANAGLTKLKIPFTTGGQVTATIKRKNVTALAFSPSGMVYNTSPPSYNFNAFVAGST